MKILSEKRNRSKTGERLLRALEINERIDDINCAKFIKFKETRCAIYNIQIHIL